MEQQLKEFLATASNEELMRIKGLVDKVYTERFKQNPGEHDTNNEMETSI